VKDINKKFRPGPALLSLLLLPVFALPIMSSAEEVVLPSYEAQILDWRQRRHDRLADDNGWMTLVALEWLEQGRNRVGSDPSSDALMPGGPARWGTVYVEGDSIRFTAAKDSGLTINGKPVKEAELIADDQGEPTVVRSGDLSFHVIHRGSYALRVKDRKAPTLLAFKGMPMYDIDPEWRIEGALIRAPEGESIPISDVLGQTNDSPVYGTFEFEKDGEVYSLIALGTEESDSLWFLFADKTSGRETYGAGRFLYSDGMPENGRLVVDFNKAYNPPCAYNDFSTCPLPPQENRLKLAVEAGEKDYGH
jgi:uncharacterized protein (DUF1684 family)